MLFGERKAPVMLITALKRDTRFNLGLKTVKNADYIEKYFKEKLFGIKFPTKNSVDAYIYVTREWSWGAPKICHFLNLGMEKKVHFRAER